MRTSETRRVPDVPPWLFKGQVFEETPASILLTLICHKLLFSGFLSKCHMSSQEKLIIPCLKRVFKDISCVNTLIRFGLRV